MSTKEIPDVIYHYTSNEVLLKILSAKALRMSARHHLNDTMEGEQFFTLLEKHKSQPSSATLDSVRRHLEPFEFFVTCFSSHYDLLSQWRGYATNGAGVAIGFKKKSITSAIQGSYEVLLYPVSYASSLSELPAGRINVIDAIFSSSGTPGQEAVQSFAKERWAIKPNGFSEEKESRLIVTVDPRTQGIKPKTKGLEIGYYATMTEVREFCDFKFGDFDGLDFIESITLGPNNRTDVDALKRHLANSGFGDVQVSRSAISYR